MPVWMPAIAWLSVGVAGLSALWVIGHESRHPLKMSIMYAVWPMTALYAGPLGLWTYHRYAIRKNSSPCRGSRYEGNGTKGCDPPSAPKFRQVAIGTMHCGAGCTLGDIIAETILAVFPGVALVFGRGHLWDDRIFSAWSLDFLLAYLLGILFQYFSIKPMHADMSWRQALIRSLQADTLSLLSWQVGMYGFMAMAHFWLFPRVIGSTLRPGSIVF